MPLQFQQTRKPLKSKEKPGNHSLPVSVKCSGGLKVTRENERISPKMEYSIREYMRNPATPNAAQGIMAMVECLNILKSAEGTICTGREMTRDDAEAWAAHMVNEDGTTVFLVEQNANQALHIANRGYVMENGVVVMEGKAQELLSSEKVRKAYLGA